MPSSVGSSIFILAAILTALSASAAVALGVVALLWEFFLFYRAGRA